MVARLQGPYPIVFCVVLEALGFLLRPSGAWFIRFLWVGLAITLLALLISIFSTKWREVKSQGLPGRVGILTAFYVGLAITLAFAHSLCFIRDTNAFTMRIGDLQEKTVEVQRRIGITKRFAFNTAAAIAAHPEFLVNDWRILDRPFGPPAERDFLGALIEADADHALAASLDRIASALEGIPSGEQEQVGKIIGVRFGLTAYTSEEIADRYPKLKADLEEFIATDRVSPVLKEIGFDPREYEKTEVGKLMAHNDCGISLLVLNAGDRDAERETAKLHAETAKAVQTFKTHGTFLYFSFGSIITIALGDVIPNSSTAKLLLVVQSLCALFFMYVFVPMLRIQ